MWNNFAKLFFNQNHVLFWFCATVEKSVSQKKSFDRTATRKKDILWDFQLVLSFFFEKKPVPQKKSFDEKERYSSRLPARRLFLNFPILPFDVRHCLVFSFAFHKELSSYIRHFLKSFLMIFWWFFIFKTILPFDVRHCASSFPPETLLIYQNYKARVSNSLDLFSFVPLVFWWDSFAILLPLTFFFLTWQCCKEKKGRACSCFWLFNAFLLKLDNQQTQYWTLAILNLNVNQSKLKFISKYWQMKI